MAATKSSYGIDNDGGADAPVTDSDDENGASSRGSGSGGGDKEG